MGWSADGGDDSGSYGRDAYGAIGNSMGSVGSSGDTSGPSGDSTSNDSSSPFGNDAYGQIGNSMGPTSTDSPLGQYGMDRYGFGNTLGTIGQSNFGSLGYGNDYGSAFGNYGNTVDSPFGSLRDLSMFGLDTTLTGPTTTFGISPYSSMPTQAPSEIGFLGSGIKSIAQQTADQTKEGIRSPTIAGWGEVTPTTARFNAPATTFANPNPEEQAKINQVVGYRYSNDPATMAAKGLSTLGQFGALANPALGLASPVGMALDAYARDKYGIPQNVTGIGGAIGNAVGATAGPFGAMIGSNLGRATGASLSGEAPAGETFGRGMLGSIANTIGGVLGGSIAGPIGAKVGSMTLGDLAKVAMAAQAYGNQRQQSRDIAEAQGRARNYSNQLSSLVQNPTSFQNSAMFKAQRAQALREGLRGLAAQGKLGSGARAYAMGNVASNIANQYYNQEANRLANLAGTSAQQVELARAKANAEGARNYQLMQLASQYLS